MQAGAISVDDFVAAVLGFAGGGFATEPMTRLLTEARIRDADVARYITFERERDVHRVTVSPQCEDAVSIHVYVRPYASCLIFDQTAREAREMRVDTFNAPF